MFKRITIIGLGLIGGSLGLAIKEKHLAKKVIGVSRRKSTIKKALSLRTVDEVTLDLKKGVKSSDLVILCAPILKIIDIGKKILPFLKEGSILIDAGSTKKSIVKSMEQVLPKGVDFIGSHPLAGSEHSGVIYADKDLFKNAFCILTKTKNTNKKTLAKVARFWNALGSKVKIMSHESHDKIISGLSHLPHAASVSLCNASRKESLHLAAGGFRDTTRIASGSPELWKDIFITNRKNISKDIRVLKKELSKIEQALKKNDSLALLRLFKKAKHLRDSM